MTLSEAIKHAEEVAEENEYDASIWKKTKQTKEVERCEKCAEEHRQLAEWLKDYKRLLSRHGMTIKELLDVIDYNREYNDEYIEIVDDNGEITARFTTTSVIASVVQDWEVSSIEAREKRVIRVWLK